MYNYYVYIMSNFSHTTFYIGVTSNHDERVYEHKEGKGSVFISKYKCHFLRYYETFNDIKRAIEREKNLKNWHREWKINLIKENNPELKDLSEEL